MSVRQFLSVSSVLVEHQISSDNPFGMMLLRILGGMFKFSLFNVLLQVSLDSVCKSKDSLLKGNSVLQKMKLTKHYTILFLVPTTLV